MGKQDGQRIVPLGDQAVMAYFGLEDEALRFAAAVRAAAAAWLVDVVQAYASVAVFFDPGRVGCREAARQLETLRDSRSARVSASGRLHAIPCCYDPAPDLERVA